LPYRRKKGWGDFDRLAEQLKTTNFTEYDNYEVVVYHWIGESPTDSLRENPIARKMAVQKGELVEGGGEGRDVGVGVVVLQVGVVVHIT